MSTIDNITNTLRDKINSFLNGGNIDKHINEVIDEEMGNAIESVRPEIKKICEDGVKDAITQIKLKKTIIDPKLITSMLNDELSNAMDTWEDEIHEAMMGVLLDELKNSSILPQQKIK